MQYCVIDIETTIRNSGEDSVGDHRASPYNANNQIVALGYTNSISGYRYIYGSDKQCEYVKVISDVRLLVLHNASFDAQWLMRSNKDEFLEWIKNGGAIWDTQIAEYILTGQECTYASLDELSLKYGGSQKGDRIKQYWESGIDTVDIPKDELLDYLKNDVLNTEIVFLKQMELAQHHGIIPLMRNAMEDRLATILMEWNGMYFHTEIAGCNADKLRAHLSDVENKLRVIVMNVSPNTHWEFNPSSPQHISKILFGGGNEYSVPVPTLNPDGTEYKYKTGKRVGEVKTHLESVSESIIGFGIKPRDEWEGKKNGCGTGIFSTSEENITELVSRTPAIPEQAKEFIELLLEFKGTLKDISTYYEGYSKLTWPTDGCIHSSINHCLTITGRLSCSAPNLTNVSREDE